MAQAITNTWNGSAQDGNYANAANWAGGVPGASDVVHLTDTTEPLTSGQDQSAISLNALLVSESFNASMGVSGDPFVFNAITTVVINGIGTEIWLDANITSLVVMMNNFNTNALVINSATAKTLTNVRMHKGRLTFGANCTFTLDLDAAGGQDAFVKVLAGSTPVTIRLTGGECEYHASAGTPDVEVSGGLFLHKEGIVTTLKQTAGTYRWKKGTITGGVIHGGKFDAASDPGIKTIGANDLIVHSAADVNVRDHQDLITGDVVPFGDPRIHFNDGLAITL